ncbi:unnamed protein product [Rotaria magnacalcarata]|uniref:Uncharacterized protein n=1 Tax=Rotaria magnacalcarata TaxID=392030 RepID=A0A816ZKY8_9BILA|nr:unnamed protein product [Rotaria magnacalcarata]CAF2219210.1 unnamed protein product [Rotaria magnacalcarata]CAF4319016.1 unnamed protein product [Rotaria magnacalcarata]CAF4379421.1 unnamed protein product [Rotaria magnacalcarata]
MAVIVQLIRHLFPCKIITHRINGLINQLPNNALRTNEIFVSIEKYSKTRQYFSCTLEALTKLYNECPPSHRNLYEVILPTNEVKTYIDFEYYIENNHDINNHFIGTNCLLKILLLSLNFSYRQFCQSQNDIDMALKQFIVLEAQVRVILFSEAILH